LGGVFMSNSIDTRVYDLLKKSLDVASLRGRVLANNIANVNTKDYKSYHVSFEDTLQANVDELDMRTSNERHIKDKFEEGQVRVEQDTTHSSNQDGNNVDVENEMVNQAANVLMYNAMITELNNKMSNTKYVINGGR
jgi:flagellar basal-body rod protein FlgB